MSVALPAIEPALVRRLAELRRLLVAFSGGADSAFLLAAAVGVLGPGAVTAATGVSPSLAAAERRLAGEFAAALGVEHLWPATGELAVAGYRANATDRCAFCKGELLDVLTPLAAARGATVATGTNADDLADRFRPGIAAAARRGAVTPLADAGLGKAAVREQSRALGLATWDKPAAPCLSSRIAYGVPVTRDRLQRVERAERALRSALAAHGLVVRDLRVRDLGDRARVELDPDLVPQVPPAALAAVRGFDRVELDPLGFRSGALNEGRPAPKE